MTWRMRDKKKSSDDSEWIRLPRPRERCAVTGLSRTSLVEIIDEKDPRTGEYFLKQYKKERHGEQRRIRMIHKQSLLNYLERRADAQNLRWKSEVNNPRNYTVQEVIANRAFFRLFIGDEYPEITDEIWEEGALSTRAARIQLLREGGLVE